MNILFPVALGGAIGALARYAVISASGHWLSLSFPYGTLAVNILGSLLLGVFIEGSALWWSGSESLRAFLVVGVLGAFTTFSAFSLDVANMMTRGETLAALFYALASVVFSVGALFLGMAGMRAFHA